MKRFVDLRSSDIPGYRFAFWCTVVDQFEKFGGDEAWDTLDEFRESCRLAEADRERPSPELEQLANRLECLVADWAHESVLDCICPEVDDRTLHLVGCPFNTSADIAQRGIRE